MVQESEIFKNKFNYLLKLKASTGYNHERFFEINFTEFQQIYVVDTILRFPEYELKLPESTNSDFWSKLH